MQTINSLKKQRDKIQVIVIDSDNDSIHQISKPIKKRKTCSIENIKDKNINLYQKIPFIPEVKLTQQDMSKDSLQFFINLQKKYEQYGAVKLIACDQWKPPFSFKYTQKGITTRVQHIHKLKKGKAFRQKNQQYNIQSFTNFAQEFSKKYKYKFKKLENEYWSIVNGVVDDQENHVKITIEYAADLPVNKYGSGFPLYSGKKSCDQYFNYEKSYFNLNNLYLSPMSILQIAHKKNQLISGVMIPWMYMGMLFSSFCWHVEDLWLNSVNYSHRGAIKTWYIIPRSDKQKFDRYVQQKTGQKSLLDRITFMLDPLELIQQQIKVYKVYQSPRQYICTFFKAYHCGFSQGFNIGEAVNFASVESLQMIKSAYKFYKQNMSFKLPVLCYDWIIYENMKHKFQESILIKKQYNNILNRQIEQIQNATKKFGITKVQQIQQNARYDRNSCSTCRHYLYLSFFKCITCEKTYCYQHLRRCCSVTNYMLLVRCSNSDKENFMNFQLQDKNN